MIGERIKELRKQKCLTQTQLAFRLGTTQKQISKWEIGYLEPNIEAIRKIAIFFDVTTDLLLEVEDEIGHKVKNAQEVFNYEDRTHKITHKNNLRRDEV